MTSELVQLLRAGESETAEFKQSTGETHEIVETVGAFANTRGGTILIGVTNAGEVQGVTVGKGTLEALTNTIHQQTDPKVFPSLTMADVYGKTMLILRVDESPIKPILVQGRGLKRVGRSNHVLSSSELTRLFFDSERMSWDAGPVPNATMDDVDAEVLRQFVHRARQERNMILEPAIPMPQVLEKLSLLYHGQLSRAAVLLFGTHPQRFLVQSEVRCARFKGTQPLHFLDMKVIEGNVIDQVPAALEFIQRHIRMAAEITPAHIVRQERWEYPLDALREALVNALCHRHYRDSGNVQVRIFDDRLEIWSPGLLPEGVTIDDLSRTHNSHPRNHRIARAFFLIGYIEQWGTGTLRMRELCQEAGLPLPDFTETSNAFIFKGAHFAKDIILVGVQWYVAYPLSYRHVEELMEERGGQPRRHPTLGREIQSPVGRDIPPAQTLSLAQLADRRNSTVHGSLCICSQNTRHERATVQCRVFMS